MSADWGELKRLYTEDHLRKDLKAPNIRLNALKNLENLLQLKMPDILREPAKLKQIGKEAFKQMVEQNKGYALNSAEKSVINGLYIFLYVLDGAEEIPTIYREVESKPQRTYTASNENEPRPKIHLYNQLADLIAEIIGESIEHHSSFSIPGLRATPLPEQFPRTWRFLAEVYNEINGAGLILDQVIKDNWSDLKMGRQEADVMITAPFNLIVEYDEEQHFNQFRAATLGSDMYIGWKGFDLETYQSLCNKILKPGSRKSGFYYLRSPDPLFPENHQSEKQDNRLRQRAFRDMVKDAWSIENGWKPTLRIPASLIGWKRHGLSQSDFEVVKGYASQTLKQ